MTRAPWIHSAAFDLFFFSFGWAAVWLAFLAWGDTYKTLLIAFVLAVSFAHRSFTHLFVYGDPEVFQERKRAYVVLPIFFLVLTVVAILLKKGYFGPKIPTLFLGLVVASTLWNFYHTIMQKMGILRIYSRKTGVGKAWLDKTILFSWLIFLTLQIPLIESKREQIRRIASPGRVLIGFLESHFSWIPYAAILALVFAVVVSVLYLREELQAPRFHWPKNLFLLSILALYGLFFHDFLAAYAAFGFSHAIEYLAFGNLFARRKYSGDANPPSFMSSFVRHQLMAMSVFGLTLFILCFFWKLSSPITLGWLITGSSFLHFLYDGWIWKLRQPKVAAPLGLAYERAA